MSPVFRFAPSPNGLLHLGHAYSAVFTAQAAEEAGGTMLLRIEDIDVVRCKPEFEAAIYEDLRWLGVTWPEPVMRQSERFAVYAEAADRLRSMGLLYPCFCSRKEIAEQASGRDPDGAPLYPGTCRGRHDAAARLAAGELATWRLDMRMALARTGALEVIECSVEANRVDLAHPRVRPVDPARWGDVVLVRKDTPTSYHLSVVVDDAAQRVTHVTRGMDLLHSTDVHVLLQRLLGLPSPVYAHHPLVMATTAEKLSKSKGSPSLRSLRADGWTLEDVRRRVGF